MKEFGLKKQLGLLRSEKRRGKTVKATSTSNSLVPKQCRKLAVFCQNTRESPECSKWGRCGKVVESFRELIITHDQELANSTKS